MAACVNNYLQVEPEPEHYDPELSLQADLVLCSKNPGHEDFIPINTINTSHFPAGYRQPWRVELVKALGDLTVQLRLSKASKERPEFFPGTVNPFPFHTPGGSDKQYRTGSAYVRRVFRYGYDDGALNEQACECVDCEGSPNPKLQWWKFEISTALHVIYDQCEAKEADVTFFFDHNHSSNKVVKKGHDVVHTDIDGDLCVFTVIVHEAELGERMMKARDCYRSNKGRVSSLDDPVIIVSHPHGLAKHVTLGNRVREEKLPTAAGGSLLVYTNCTCRGSSGGPVVGPWTWAPGMFWMRGCPHSGALLDGNNQSGLAWLN